MGADPGGFIQEGTSAQDNLIAGDFPLRTIDVTISSGQNLTRGALLGKITSGGEFILSLSAAGDGSQTPAAILAKDVDASGGDVAGVPVYVSGDFNERALTYGTGHTADSVRDALHKIGIHLQPSVAA